MSATAPIGIFDCGVGGLTVIKALRERIPDSEFEIQNSPRAQRAAVQL